MRRCIAAGALLACFLNGSLPAHTRRTRSWCIGLGTLLLLGAGALGINEDWPVLVTYPLAAAASVAIIFGTLGAGLRAGAYLGKISYGLYVFHAAVIRVVPSPILALPLTVAIAALSYRYLESPFLRLKDRFVRL